MRSLTCRDEVFWPNHIVSSAHWCFHPQEFLGLFVEGDMEFLAPWRSHRNTGTVPFDPVTFVTEQTPPDRGKGVEAEVKEEE